MALQKAEELENGIKLNYHRITSLNKLTNIANIIEINSYTSAEQREKEKEYQALQQKNDDELTTDEKQQLLAGINVYIYTRYVQVAYDEEQNIEEAYAYLKTLDEFKDATDV